MLSHIAARASKFWRADGLPATAALAWRAEWVVGVILIAVGTLLYLGGADAARTAPREHADAGMFGVVLGALAAVGGVGVILTALSLRVPGRWRWAGQIAAALALLYLAAQCAT